MSIYVIAEIGINHNGSVDQALRLIEMAAACGADAVKFQKRTVEAVYSAEDLAQPRASVFGTTNGDLKRGLEFGPAAYDKIFAAAKKAGVACSASAWDAESVAFLAAYQPPWLKVPSALVTDRALLRAYRATGLPCYVSTGMSTWEEIDGAVATLAPGQIAALLHCHSAYPSPLEELNLACLPQYRERYPSIPVGYSSHSVSPWPCLMAAVAGATVVETHLTLDRTLWGSDQAASLEPVALQKLVTELRTWEVCRGDGVKRVWDSERPAQRKLRKVTA